VAEQVGLNEMVDDVTRIVFCAARRLKELVADLAQSSWQDIWHSATILLHFAASELKMSG